VLPSTKDTHSRLTIWVDSLRACSLRFWSTGDIDRLTSQSHGHSNIQRCWESHPRYFRIASPVSKPQHYIVHILSCPILSCPCKFIGKTFILSLQHIHSPENDGSCADKMYIWAQLDHSSDGALVPMAMAVISSKQVWHSWQCLMESMRQLPMGFISTFRA